VNILGYIAENLLSGLIDTVQWNEVDDLRARGAQFVDVRTADEFVRGSLPGAVNIPVDQLRDRYRELDAVDIVVNCEVGQRGYVANDALERVRLSSSQSRWRLQDLARFTIGGDTRTHWLRRRNVNHNKRRALTDVSSNSVPDVRKANVAWMWQSR